MPPRNPILLLIPILLSFGLGLQLLDRFPLREDEARYSYWALHLRNEDPWMLTVWPDKPPLYLWSQAAVFSLVDATQATARLLNIGVTTATVALLAATSRRLWHANGTLAALLYALNPFALSFAATAYTDPLLLFCGQLAFYLALRGRMMGAGMAVGAAIMTKQQGLLYLPLLVALSLMPLNHRLSLATRINFRRFVALLVGITLVLLPTLYGDSLRWTVAPSPWDLSVRNYGALALLSPAQWGERARGWLALLWYMGGSWWVWSLYGLLALFGLSRWRADGAYSSSHPLPASPANRGGAIIALPRAPLGRGGSWGCCLNGRAGTERRLVLLLPLWVFGFLFLHMVTTIQIWDRYLLPLIPVFVLSLSGAAAQSVRVGARHPMLLANVRPGTGLAAIKRSAIFLIDGAANPMPLRATSLTKWYSVLLAKLNLGPGLAAIKRSAIFLIDGAANPMPLRARGVALWLFCLVLLTPTALRAAQGGLPIGGDHGAYGGLQEAVAWLRAERQNAPDQPPFIVYQQRLGWQLQFYLYREERQAQVEVRWVANAVTLADNAAKSAAQRRFILEPSWVALPNLALHMATRNLHVIQQRRFGNMILYEIENRPQAACDWCLCHVKAQGRDKEKTHTQPFLWPTLPAYNHSPRQAHDLYCRREVPRRPAFQEGVADLSHNQRFYHPSRKGSRADG